MGSWAGMLDRRKLGCLFGLLALLVLLFPLPSLAATCVQNGGTNANCVAPDKDLWRGTYYDGTTTKTTLYNDLVSAIRGTAHAYRMAQASIHGEDRYNLGVQWSSFDYQSFGVCSNPQSWTDSSYTDPTNLATAGSTFSVRVHVHGKVPKNCPGVPGAYEYYSPTSSLTVTAEVGCPRGYYLVDEKASGVPRTQTFPYDHMCAKGSSDVAANAPINDEVPDCQTAPTRGCVTTGMPLSIASRRKNEAVTDLTVPGPWPLAWTRVAMVESASASWLMPGGSLLVRGQPTSGTFSGKQTATIIRRNGARLTFIASSGSGPATWQMGVNAHRNTAFLEEIWVSSQLMGYRLSRRDGVQEIFNAQGQLVRETNASGQNHHYVSTGGFLSSIHDDFGNLIVVQRDDGQGWSTASWDDPEWDPDANDGEGEVVENSGSSPITDGGLSATAPERVIAVSDGTREVIYEWGNSTSGVSSNVDILLSVDTPSGKTWGYVYGENVDGSSTGSHWMTGVVGPDLNRHITYRRNSSGLVSSEWYAAGPNGVGALERVNVSTSAVTDADGRSFSFNASSSDVVNSQSAPWPQDWLGGGANTKTLGYQLSSSAPSGTANSSAKKGEVLSETDWRNTNTTYTYDSADRMLTRTESDNVSPTTRTITWTYPTDPGLRAPLTQVEPIVVGGNAYTRTTTWAYTELAASYPSTSPCLTVPTGTPECATTRRLLTSKTVSTTVPGETARTWTYTYNSYGLLDTETDPAGVVTQYTYTTQGLPATKTVGHGTALAQTTTLGGTSPFGPLWQEDASGLVSRWSFDGEGNVTQVQTGTKAPGGLGAPSGGGGSPYTGTGTWNAADGGVWRTTTYTYDLYNRPTLAIEPSGLKTDFTYNGAGRVVEVQRQTAAGTPIWTLTYTRSVAGLITGQTLRQGSATGTIVQQASHTYSATRFLASTLDAFGEATVYGYDANGQPNSTTSPLGYTQGTTYDVLNRPTALTNALSGVTNLGWDVSDNLVSVQDPGGATTVYTYNGFGDITSIVSPDSGTTQLAYQANGRLDARQDARGVTTSYTYDALGRVTGETFDDLAVNTATWGSASGAFVPGTQVRTISYTGCGSLNQMCSITESAGTTTYSYNAWGQLLTRSWTGATGSAAAGLTLLTTYSYLPDGRVSTITYPSGKVLSVSYRTDGDVDSLTFDGQVLLDDATWTMEGKPASWTWGMPGLPVGKDTVLISHDTNGLPNGYQDVATRTIVRDDDTRVVGIDDAFDVSKSQLFGWDARNRLTFVDIGGWAAPMSYGWTANTNLNQKLDTGSNNGFAWTYGASTNRLATWATVTGGTTGSGTSIHFDPAGNQVGDGVGRTWKYDATNRLAWASDGVRTTTYGYAGMVRRTAVTGSTVKLYEVDEAGRRLGEYVKDASQPSGWRAIQEFVYLDGHRIVGLADYNSSGAMNALLAVLSDPLTGTPRQVMDADGDSRWDWDAREAFGYQVPNTSPTSGKAALTFDARFPGQWADETSGTYHNNWREYWPRVGRYTQVDPIGLAGGENPYAYVMGNPVGAVDPEGLLRIYAYGNAGAGSGIEMEYEFHFDPISIKDASKISKLVRYGNRLATAIKHIDVKPAGPKRGSNYMECRSLDEELLEAYSDLGFIEGDRLTRPEAENLLRYLRRAHPKMIELYPEAEIMLDAAEHNARSGWFGRSQEGYQRRMEGI